MFQECMNIKAIMAKYGYPWFIAGGWAIDLYLGEKSRNHEDLEIGIFRKDQMKLFKYFEKQEKQYIDNRSKIGKYEKKEWNKEYLRLPIHELEINVGELRLEVLINERDEDYWIYRRNDKIKYSINKTILLSKEKVPYLCPEIAILYKTKNTRDKDIIDIKNVVPRLNDHQVNWLIDSIEDIEIKNMVRNLTIAST